MKKLGLRNLIRTLPGLLAAAGLLVLGSNLNAGGSRSNCKSAKPPKCEPKKKKPAPKPCKPCNKCKPPKPQPRATSFSGQASVIYFTNLTHGPYPTVIIADTGPLASTGGSLEASVTATNVAGYLELQMAQASTRGGGSEARSEASVANVILSVQTMSDGIRVFGIEHVQAAAEAECSAEGVLFHGGATVTGLTIDGMAVAVTGNANQEVVFPGGRLIINYQAAARTATEGTVTVAGLVFMVDGCLHGTIAATHADIVCGTTPPVKECHDFVTGGGFIFGTPSGERANFGVAGGVRKRGFWGHLNYIDHSTGMHVKSTRVTGYEDVDEVTRLISYDVTIDGAAGTANVLVADNGEPGRDDLFAIELSTGYEASGDLGGSGHGGGNIQLHKMKCKCKPSCHPRDGDDDDDDGNGHDDDDDGKGHDDDDDGKGGDDDDDNGNGHKCDSKCKPKCKNKGHDDDDDDGKGGDDDDDNGNGNGKHKCNDRCKDKCKDKGKDNGKGHDDDDDKGKGKNDKGKGKHKCDKKCKPKCKKK